MINEASELGIAMNLVESKLANKTIEMRKKKDEENILLKIMMIHFLYMVMRNIIQ